MANVLKNDIEHRHSLASNSNILVPRSNVVQYDSPVFAKLLRCVARSSVDLSGQGALHLTVGRFETRQQLGSDERTLIRLEFKRLLQDVAAGVGHGAILPS
jgi:hypothetical protein